MLRFAVIGCGRIGRMHADNLTAHPRAALELVYDIDAAAAAAVAGQHGARVAAGAAAVFADTAVDAVLVASATPTHADLIEASVAAGRPVLCEKPIDLDLARVERCRDAIAGKDVPVQIGFNRRFDPGHQAARNTAHSGEIGDLHQVIISSRDPEIPPRGYVAQAGGLMRDMTIHDFDLARYMLGDEPAEVFAVAGPLADPAMGAELGEVDTAMIIMRTADGKQCHINNSRTAAYGYDQRIELLGSRGMVLSDNRKPHEMRRYSAGGVETAPPYLYFFIERYQEAFMAELTSFIDSIETGRSPEVGFEDGRRALILAEAAYRSVAEKRLVAVSEIA